ncbi:MAG: helix-turn-helix domain-containing protein [Bacteroidales bacterium]|jgi:DNA-binding transcriptional regulator YiaG|nr:helix-turn-helix domain-containing protein [Bacteroidales bacterium]
MEFKDKVKTLRQKMLHSQEEFAKVLGVAFSTVNHWENAKTKPNYKGQRAVQELCEKYNITDEE